MTPTTVDELVALFGMPADAAGLLLRRDSQTPGHESEPQIRFEFLASLADRLALWLRPERIPDALRRPIPPLGGRDAVHYLTRAETDHLPHVVDVVATTLTPEVSDEVVPPARDPAGAWLVLDVDGVVAPVDDRHGAQEWRPPADDDWGDWQVIAAGLGAPISRRLGEALAQLPAKKIWLTSWGAMANREELLSTLGWTTPLPVAAVDDGPGWRKSAALARLIGKMPPDRRPDRLVWIDDQLLDFRDEVRDTLLGMLEDGSLPDAVLLIAPAATRGLTRADIDLIGRFLNDPHGCTPHSATWLTPSSQSAHRMLDHLAGSAGPA